MAKHQIALQLYTVRDMCDEDFFGTIRKVAELGYHGVEFGGFYERSAAEVKALLQELNLTPVGSHIGLNLLKEHLPEIVEFHQEIGCNLLICPWVNPERFSNREKLDEFCTELREIGSECKKNRMGFAYHNHAFEFNTRLDDKPAHDYLMGQILPDVLPQLDLYWVQKGGEDPAAYIRKYAGTVPVVHLKDMEDSADQFFAEVGTGLLDLSSVFAAGDASGVQWYTVEQDKCRHHEPYESAKISIDNLKKLGFA